MCGSMADIQSATRKKEEEEEKQEEEEEETTGWKYNVRIRYSGRP